MKKGISIILAIVLTLTLFGCQTSQTGTGSDQTSQTGTGSDGEKAQDNNQAGQTKEESATETSSMDDSTSETSSDTESNNNNQTYDIVDKFIFRTSEEMKAFMLNFEPTEEFQYGQKTWSMSSDEVTFSGSLMPDLEHFYSLTIEPKSKLEEEKISPVLLSAYQELCDKTGLSFEGAEDAIKQIATLESDAFFSSEGYTLSLSEMGNRYFLKMNRDHSEYGSLPYTVEAANAYMQSIGGQKGGMTRSVKALASSENSRFSWSGSLDEYEHLNRVTAEYYGDDPEEGKTYFSAFIEFFLMDDIREGALKLVSEKYDTIGKNKVENATVDNYLINLRNRSDHYELIISVSGMNISPDVPSFLAPGEVAELQQDPFAKLGVNIEPTIPETVLYDHDGIKVVLEKCIYTTSGPSLMFVFRVEEFPDDAYLSVNLKEINGVSTDAIEDITATTNDYSRNEFSVRTEDWSSDDKEFITMTISALQQITDFTGITSVTFDGTCINGQTEIPLEESTLQIAQ